MAAPIPRAVGDPWTTSSVSTWAGGWVRYDSWLPCFHSDRGQAGHGTGASFKTRQR